MKRFCYKCETEGDFSPTGKMCRECNKEYQRLHYQRNKAKYKAKSKDHLRKLEAIVIELKQKPCTRCGNQYPHVAMDFHHILDKDETVSNLVRNQVSIKRLLAEITKCELVCAVCHRCIHFMPGWSNG